MTNITSSYNYDGVALYKSNSNIFRDVECNVNGNDGIFVSFSSANVFENVETKSNGQCGIYLFHSPSNILMNILSKYNRFAGVYIDLSPFTVINDSELAGNRQSGINTNSGDCLIYNSYFSNNNNVNFVVGTTVYGNDWNVTNTTGTNVIGESFIGGNYWSGYTGVDANRDGFIDTPYNLSGDGLNIDYLPLTEVDDLVDTVMYIRNGGQDLRVGDSWEYLVTCRDEYGMDCDCGELSWNSSNTTVGSMDGAILTCLAAGVTNITAIGFNGTDNVLQEVGEASSLNGDVDGDGIVDIDDARKIAKYVVGLPGYQDINTDAADVTGDGIVDISDAMYLAKHVIGISGFENLR